MLTAVFLVFASGISLLGVEAETNGITRSDPGAEPQLIEVSSHHFESHGIQHSSENVGRLMRSQRTDELKAEAKAGADENPLTQLLKTVTGGGSQLTGDTNASVVVNASLPKKEKTYDVTWGAYKFDLIGGTRQCVQSDASAHDSKSFFELWDGTDLGLSITEGTTTENGLMKRTAKGLRIYKSACPDDVALTVGGQTMLPAGTTTVEFVFGIIERCTGNCAPFAVSFWHGATGTRKKRWCWNHEGHQSKVPCEENLSAEFAQWQRAMLNISDITDGGTEPIKMALEVYTSGDFRLKPALNDEAGIGGRAMVLIDSLIIGPVQRPSADNNYTQTAKPCRATLTEVCRKNVWCFEKYRCDAGWCIEGEGRCNNRRNCGDDSDEVGCEYDMGFLGEFYLNHAQRLQDEDIDNVALVDSLQKADMRRMHEQIHYDSQDFWDKFHVKEFFAAKWLGNISIKEGGHYFFHFKHSGVANITLQGVGELSDKNWNVTSESWLHLSPGLYEMNVKFVHRRGHPNFDLQYFGEDTVGRSIAVPREVVKTNMPGSRCDTFTCPEGTISKANNLDILCKGVPCNDITDVSTCCNREYKVVSAGDYQTCALDKLGRPVCWGSWPGYNEEWKKHPGPFADISTRSKYTCAVKQADGGIDCWTSSETSTPWVDYSGGGVFTNVSVGGDHTCALRDSGFLACTGADTDSQIYPPSNVEFERVAAGSDFTCGIEHFDMSVRCWGSNSRGQARPPSGRGHYSYTHIAAGSDHVCGISNGTAYCWGENNNGQATAPAATEGFIEVAPGGRHTCALDGKRQAVCWGANSDGQSTPSQGDGPFKTLTSGEAHTCAIKSSDDSVVCWGSNFEDGNDGSLNWRGQSEPPPAGHWP